MKIQDQKCDHELEVRDRMFYHSKTGMMPGLVCNECKSLYDWPEYSFLKAVEE